VVTLVLRRLAAAIPLALGAATLVYVLMQSAPGRPSDLLLGDRPVPPEVRERIERAYGFDRPPLQAYLCWLSALTLHGELGWSHARAKPVATVLRETLPNTALLAAAALAIHLAVGLLLGLVSAAWRGRWPDRAVMVAGLLLYGMPAFWIGLMAILLLSFKAGLFPAASLQSVGAEQWSPLLRWLDRLWHLALPAAVLGLASAAAMTRFVRAGLLAALSEEFVRAARARGLSDSRVLVTHALRNALIPVVNLVGLSLPVLLSGSLVVEVVFAWPGMGRLTYDAIHAHDPAVVLATVLLSTLFVLLGSLLADLAMVAVDPRIRLARGDGA